MIFLESKEIFLELVLVIYFFNLKLKISELDELNLKITQLQENLNNYIQIQTKLESEQKRRIIGYWIVTFISIISFIFSSYN